MNILYTYTRDTLRRSRHTAAGILAAILLVSTMFSALSGFLYTMWYDLILSDYRENGNWHGELYDTTYGSDLDVIENFASVETVMIKGDWHVARCGTGTRRDYLIERGANAAYWANMAEQYVITAGRVPARPGEIALSKQYFDDHPDVQIGDTLTLPIGDRMLDGAVLSEVESRTPGETFTQTGTATYTVVACLDVTTPSSVPAYTGISYLDETDIRPDDQLTVYLRFTNIRDTYEELPALAAALGWQTDEYGDYNLRYNSTLLLHNLILPPEQWANLRDNFSFMDAANLFAIPLMFACIGLLTVAVFVLIIHNAFALSADARLRQLGILASVGATPRQIRRSVLYEGLLLSVLPLPVGLALGYLADWVLFAFMNSQTLDRTAPVVFVFGLPAVLPAIALTLVTVLLSSWLPAHRVARMSPLAAIRMGDAPVQHVKRTSRLARQCGILGELADCALRARRRSYRTATLSLTLSCALLSCLLLILSTQEANRTLYPDPRDAYDHVSFYFQDGNPPDPDVMQDIRGLDGVANAVYRVSYPVATWLPAEAGSDELDAALGGLSGVAATGKYYPIERDGLYRLGVSLIGLDDASFDAYCTALGIDPAPYHAADGPAVFYNQTSDPRSPSNRTPSYLDILDLAPGDTLHCTDRVYDEDNDDGKADFEFDLTVGAVVNQKPPVSDSYSRFTGIVVLPMDRALALGAQTRRAISSTRGYVTLAAPYDLSSEAFYTQVAAVSAQVKARIEQSYGSGDYSLTNLSEQRALQQTSDRVMKLVIWFLALLFACIGLSNIWTTITGNLRQRAREFAMLRSAGLSPAGLTRMLRLESLFLGLRPVLYSLPLSIGTLLFFLDIVEVEFTAYLPFLPALPLGVFYAGVVAVVMLAYTVGARRLLRQNIVETVRTDAV